MNKFPTAKDASATADDDDMVPSERPDLSFYADWCKEEDMVEFALYYAEYNKGHVE